MHNQPSRTQDLNALCVRPIQPGEKDRWNHLIETHHYLHSRRLVGESIRYVATLSDKWVALLGWTTGAFKLNARDEWIGWSEQHQSERFKFIVNNSRFLVLPGVQIKNLASRALAMNMKRLSKDWLSAYAHNVVLVETFVDPTLYQGTCYQAAGFSLIGRTKGYGISAGDYYYHGNRKLIFVRPLYRKAIDWLVAPFLTPFLLEGSTREALVNLNRMPLYGKDGLLGYMNRIPDWRNPGGRRHSLGIVLSLVVSAVLAGVEIKFARIADWIKRLPWSVIRALGGRRYYGAPSEPTIRRTMQTVDPKQVVQEISRWLLRHNKSQVIPEVEKRIHALCQRRAGGGRR